MKIKFYIIMHIYDVHRKHLEYNWFIISS